MSKPALDSDLYGDIYGDDDIDYPQTETADDSEPTLDDEPPEQSTPSPVNESTSQQSKKPPPASQDPHRSLPPKPMSPNSLSYSAQVAQQFSAYQQTPSQERQQRAEIPLPQNPRASGAASTSNMAREDTSSSDNVFGKKPSEMHDSGVFALGTNNLATPRPLQLRRTIHCILSFYPHLPLHYGPTYSKLFIGGLNWDTTDGILPLHHIAITPHTAAKVDACTIMRDPSGTSRGFAFLTFEDANAVNAVVACDHVLDGKAIDPKRAIPREEHLRNTRYFVGGLSPTTTSDSMKEFFSAYGKVVDATVMVDRESGRSKGFGFVTYEDASNADQLVGKIGLILDDKQALKMAQPRSQRDQARAAVTSTGVGGRDTTPTFSTQGNQGMSSNISFTQQQQPNQMSMMFQRPIGQVPMMGANMPMMNMNPMAMAAMGMGMGGFNPMAAGMNGMNMMGGMNGMNSMGGAMNSMGNMNAMSGMGNMGAMRLGMGPMGMAGTGMGAGGMGTGGMGAGGMGAGMGGTGMVGAGGMGGMNAMGMGMRPNMAGMGVGAVNPNFGRMTMNAAAAGPGPARITSRGQHSFHPYSR
ncbi:hypothetical protein D9615_008024 [Tricholomella constricta]|uniref:RRM domain-containing protein n=1 Tax=Tricholomella constricta TaxID=117010 RepID=A0A8H5LZ46_9AGAR|nr:hypothetical protein D9615_008024 [Tricholomella constricta]